MATITWYGHATFRLELTDERVLFIDPWLEGNPACPASLHKPDRCDMILLTHGHADHVSGVAALIKRFDPVIVANYDLCVAMKQHFGKGRYEGMNTGGSLTVENVRVSLTQAFHSSAIEADNELIYGGMPNGLMVDAMGLARVYHAGDTDVFSDMALIRRLWAPQVCILPIGDRFTMGAAGAAIAAELLEPAAILPCHYATFPQLAQDANAFRQALPANLRDRLHVPDVGKAVTWSPDGLKS